MPTTIPRVILLLLLLLLLTVVSDLKAQEPEFKMPCPQVLKLGLNKFVDAYGEKTDDYSTYGQKQAFNYYVDCRRPANDLRALKLSETRRKQVEAIRDKLNAIGDASWSNAYIVAGGGTMYGLAGVGAYAVREDFMTLLINSLLNSERPNPAARRRANTFINRARRALPSTRSPNLEYWDDGDRPNQLKHYLENAKKVREAFTELQTLIRILPDRAAELVARKMEGEITAGLE